MDSLSLFFQGISAIAVAYIGYQNYKINAQNNIVNNHNYRIERDNLRLALFEKRHTVYRSVKDVMQSYFVNGKLTYDDLSKFNDGTRDVNFLFGDEIKQYIENMRTNILGSIQNERRYDINSGSVLVNLAEDDIIYNYFSSQRDGGINNMFDKYLRFIIKK